jgi:hypothetical protein
LSNNNESATIPFSKKIRELNKALVDDRKILGVTSDVSEGCWDEFLNTNKKTNYRTRQETARRI